MQNTENIERREVHCSFCGESGHNRSTCINQRLLDFEIACSTECQNLQEDEFKDWLLQTYQHNIPLLKAFVYRKMRIQTSLIQNILFYINKITYYIYETYKYNYNINMYELDVTLPELIPLESENNNNNNTENQYNDIESVDNLIRHYNSNTYINYYSSNFNIYLETIYDLTKIKPKHKKFTINSTIEPLPNNINKEQTSECIICFETYNTSEFIILNCQHTFCNHCIKKSLHNEKKNILNCAYCRREITNMIFRTNTIHDEMSEFII
jgi:hypothetical protein